MDYIDLLFVFLLLFYFRSRQIQQRNISFLFCDVLSKLDSENNYSGGAREGEINYPKNMKKMTTTIKTRSCQVHNYNSETDYNKLFESARFYKTLPHTSLPLPLPLPPPPPPPPPPTLSHPPETGRLSLHPQSLQAGKVCVNDETRQAYLRCRTLSSDGQQYQMPDTGRCLLSVDKQYQTPNTSRCYTLSASNDKQTVSKV